MITYTQIAELSDKTSLPLIEIIRALARSNGDSRLARARLMPLVRARDEQKPLDTPRSNGA